MGGGRGGREGGKRGKGGRKGKGRRGEGREGKGGPYYMSHITFQYVPPPLLLHANIAIVGAACRPYGVKNRKISHPPEYCCMPCTQCWQ